MPGAKLSHPFGANEAVFTIDDKMFAIAIKNSDPTRVSLRCDSQLAELLRQKYETVLPGQNLNKKYWNTIVCSGQLTDEEIKDLIVLSYNLTKESSSQALSADR